MIKEQMSKFSTKYFRVFEAEETLYCQKEESTKWWVTFLIWISYLEKKSWSTMLCWSTGYFAAVHLGETQAGQVHDNIVWEAMFWDKIMIFNVHCPLLIPLHEIFHFPEITARLNYFDYTVHSGHWCQCCNTVRKRVPLTSPCTSEML